MDTENTAAITALAVAVVALLVAIGQILGQYFSTADGYRRCQEVSIGGWAKMTRRHFRWSQLRFEVLYTTPHIGMYGFSGEEDSGKGWPYRSESSRRIDGSDKSRNATFTIARKSYYWAPRGPSYLVSWVNLIEGLQDVHLVYGKSIGEFKGLAFGSDCDLDAFNPALSTPYVEPHEQTWDIMPPDLLRPVASASLGEIITLAHRLGMGWREIRIGTGVLHGEGHGQAMIGSMSRGFGILLQYTRDGAFLEKNHKRYWERLVIPSRNSDKLGFGIIPGSLGIPDLSLQAEDDSLLEIDSTMSTLLIQESEQSTIRRHWREGKNFTGFSDVIALVPPFLPVEDSSITTVHRPLPDINGPLFCREGRQAFRLRLEDEVSRLRESGSHDILPALKDLLNRCTRGFEDWSGTWSNDGEEKAKRNNRDIGLLRFLREQHDFCTDLLCDILVDASLDASRYASENSFRFTYLQLVGAHLSQATSAHIDASMLGFGHPQEELAPQYRTPPGMDPVQYQAFNIYVRNLPHTIERVKITHDPNYHTICIYKHERLLGRGSQSACPNIFTVEPDQKIRLAWWLMIFRAQCWYLSVSLIGPLDGSSNGRRGIIVPSSLWNSQVLIHIV